MKIEWFNKKSGNGTYLNHPLPLQYTDGATGFTHHSPRASLIELSLRTLHASANAVPVPKNM